MEIRSSLQLGEEDFLLRGLVAALGILAGLEVLELGGGLGGGFLLGGAHVVGVVEVEFRGNRANSRFHGTSAGHPIFGPFPKLGQLFLPFT